MSEQSKDNDEDGLISWRERYHLVESYPVGDSWCIRVTMKKDGLPLAAIAANESAAERRMRSILMIGEVAVDPFQR